MASSNPESVTFCKESLLSIKKRRSNKAARLIVRNLPFTCKEEDLFKHFSIYGTLKEVVLLRKNGRFVGCGFIQFNTKVNATKALMKTSGKLFRGRPIIVDWAVPKYKFRVVKCSKNEKDNSKETADSKLTIKQRKIHEKRIKSEKINHDDVLDGKTVFFKDIPFHTTNEKLKECAEQLAGPVEYAVICTDQITEHPKGTGFIRFKEKDVADQVLSNNTKLMLSGQELSSHKMLRKDDLEKMKRKTITKDKRNLYLIKEGVILAGSLAAKGVSQFDMNKRLLLEQERSKILRNLQKFISPTRLVIYNLPNRNFDNKRLLSLFKSHSPKGAIINEARVMRNLKDLDEKGIPVSKGYGYVSFVKHQDALAALRAINNNPSIFTEKKRPIVSFSIEDKKVLLIRRKRQEKSKVFLQTYQLDKDSYEKISTSSASTSKAGTSEGYIPDNDDEVSSSTNNRNQLANQIRQKKKSINSKELITSTSDNFTGLSSTAGKKKLSSKHKLQKQATLHKVNLKKDKIKQKVLKNKLSRRQKRLKKLADKSS